MNPQVTADLVSFFSGLITKERLSLFQKVLANRTRYITTLLAGVDNPQDVSAVMRSCECFGIQDVHLAGASRFAATKGIAVGAVKWLTMTDHAESTDTDETCGAAAERAARFLHTQQRTLVGVHDDPHLPSLETIRVDRPLTICFTRSQTARKALEPFATHHVRIPTVGFGTGFNLSVQAALCFSWLRSQLAQQQIEHGLNADQKQTLLLEWLLSMRQKGLGRILTRFMDDYGYDTQALLDIAGPEALRARVHLALAPSDK